MSEPAHVIGHVWHTRWQRVFQRRRSRLAVVLLTVLMACAAVAIQSCSMPGPKASKQAIAALERRSVLPAAGGPEADNAAPPMPLSYLRAGDASRPRVIYIHGTPGSAEGWADFLVSPVPGLEAIAIDRPGFGKSGPLDGTGMPDFAHQAGVIVPLLAEREGRWPILVGHSLGGPIAAWLAATHPDRVSGLVIVAGSLDPAEERPGLAQRIATTDVVRYFLPRALDNSMGELDAARTQTTLLAPLLDKITCPVIVIHGDADELVPVANVGYIQRMFTGAKSLEVRELKKQGHFVPWERPEVVREAVETLAR